MSDYPTNPTLTWDQALDIVDDLESLYDDPHEEN